MKTLVFVLLNISLFSYAQAYSLKGNDAGSLAKILHDAGISEIWDVTFAPVSAREVYCVGQNFQDTCKMLENVSDPHQSPKTISGEAASHLWSLLKKSGIQNTTGAHGESMIIGGAIDCTLYSYKDDECSINAEW